MGAADGAHERDLHRRSRALVQRDLDLVGLAVGPVRGGDGVGGRGQARHAVGRDEDLDAVLLRVDAVLGVGARDHDAAVVHEDGLGVVEARDGGVGHDAHALVDGRGGVVEDGVEVGPVGEAEARDAVGCAVEDDVGPVGEGGDARHDALRRHALQRPHWIGDLGLGGDAVVDGGGGAGRGAAADHEGDGGGVRRVLGHQHRSPLEWVVAPGKEVVDGSGDVWQLRNRIEVDWFQDSGLVVVSNKDVSGRKHGEERIKVVRIRSVEVVTVQHEAARRFRKNFERRNRWTVGSILATHNENRSIGHDHGAGIPSSSLERHLFVVLLPIVHTGLSRRSIRPVQSDSECRLPRPSAKIDLPSNPIRHCNTCGAEHIGLDVHRPPKCRWIINLGKI